MGYCKKDVTPLLMRWSYVFLALSHRYHRVQWITMNWFCKRPFHIQHKLHGCCRCSGVLGTRSSATTMWLHNVTAQWPTHGRGQLLSHPWGIGCILCVLKKKFWIITVLPVVPLNVGWTDFVARIVRLDDAVIWMNGVAEIITELGWK